MPIPRVPLVNYDIYITSGTRGIGIREAIFITSSTRGKAVKDLIYLPFLSLHLTPQHQVELPYFRNIRISVVKLVLVSEYLKVNILLIDSVKKSVRKTAAEFMSLVPMFSRRLAQRDYDFILVNPVKKRLLLKMYIMGMFMVTLFTY